MSAILPRAATFSKGSEFWGVDFTPQTISAGRRGYITADDDKQYLDWVSGLGANLLGHAHPDFAAEVTDILHSGTAFSLPHYLEGQTAARLVDLLGAHVPGWSHDTLSVRFGLSGSDACAMAVRLARAVTSRQRIVSIGYHGWHSEFIAAMPPFHGVPAQPVTAVSYGDLDRLARTLREDVACVIIEQPPQFAPLLYWPQVQELCHDAGALLVVDEVVTGLRFAHGGACELLGIAPDIVCLGKALGNGVPISAMVFRREYASWFARRDPVFVSSTHFGNPLGLAAADWVLRNWTEVDIEHLHTIGTALIDGLTEAGYTVAGYAPVSLLVHSSESHRAYFIRAMRDRGILMNRPNIPCRAHTLADVARTVTAAREIAAEMAACDVAEVMAGKLPEVLFAGR